MGTYSDTITFNAVSLNVTSLTPVYTQKTRKTIVGKTLVQVKVIGMGAQQWNLILNGLITGATTSTLSTNRAALEALDDASSHAFVDGIHDGEYVVIPGSLSFKDSNDRGNRSYVYSMKLVEW